MQEKTSQAQVDRAGLEHILQVIKHMHRLAEGTDTVGPHGAKLVVGDRENDAVISARLRLRDGRDAVFVNGLDRKSVV